MAMTEQLSTGKEWNVESSLFIDRSFNGHEVQVHFTLILAGFPFFNTKN